MDLFDYMREQNKEKRIATGIQTSSDETGRSSGTAAHHRQR